MTDGFFVRLKRYGIKRLVICYDTLAAILSFIFIGLLTNWQINYCSVGQPLLQSLITISATFFSIILAAFTLFSTFTNERYILAWISTGEFENIITIFQYNLYLPIVVLILSIFLRYVVYVDILMVLTISIFIYMLFSLLDLVEFLAKYVLQKGEFLEVMHNNNQNR